MKDLYYLIVRDEHEDTEPVIDGPFDTIKATQEYAHEEYEPADMIFTVIALTPGGTATHEKRYVSQTSAWNWV